MRTTIRLADPSWELRFADTNELVPSGYFWHEINAKSEQRYRERLSKRTVIIQPFTGWHD
jgi:hypothetical protein